MAVGDSDNGKSNNSSSAATPPLPENYKPVSYQNIGIDEDDKDAPNPSAYISTETQQLPQPQQPQQNTTTTSNNSPPAKRTGTLKITRATPLISAVYDHHIDKAEELIKTNPHLINVAEPNQGYTPLLLAMENTNEDMALRLCKTLIEHGAIMRVMTRGGHTPFGQAASFGHVKILQYMASIDPTLVTEVLAVPPILLAAEKGHLSAVQWLVENGAYIYAQLGKASINNKGVMAIHQAACKGNLEVVRYFVERCNVFLEDRSNKLGTTPLYLAIEQNQLAVAEYLLLKGANPNVMRTDGFFGLYMASQKGLEEMIKLILRFGANPNQVTLTGNTPLDVARKFKHANIINILTPITSPQLCKTTPETFAEPKGCNIM